VTTPSAAAHNPSCESSQPPLKRFKLLAADMQSRATVSSSSSTCQANVDTELIAYFADAHASDHSSSLSYWLQHQAKYPLLAPLAADLLSAPASQAYVERVFSVCGDLCAGKRNRLTKGLEMRAFLKCNHKYYE